MSSGNPVRSDSQPLDIRSFPLRGSQLIEASAGTGKTFTIALLYARLILQHGGDAAFPRALTPEDILVVTFTDAATQELKDRIRARLSDAARCFIKPDTECDDVLRLLRDDYDAALWPQCGRLLSMAAQSMDQAAVSTIHGWCYRMLREHAFDSGSLFQQTLITNQQDMFADLIRDYWRQHFYALPETTARIINREFGNPETLLQAVRPLIHKTNTTLTFAGETLPEISDLTQTLAGFAKQAREIARLEEAARSAWAASRAELEDLLDELQAALNKNSYAEAKTPDGFAALKQSLADWAQGGDAPARMVRFAQDQWKLSGGKKAPAQPQHPALAAIADWLAESEAADNSTGPNVRALVLSHARRWLETALHKRLQEKAELGFDDLLLQLDRALQGPLGDKLAAQIRRDYPVAMIDEFQDTDPLQYRIFDKIYQLSRNHADSALIMIGDPKQAIYSFRNADIHTYLAARQATAGRHYNLGTNYRSTQGIVDGINYLFAQAETFTAGAFRFRQGEHNPLPFLPVAAKGRDQTLIINSIEAPAITFWHLGSVSDDDEYEDRVETIAITQFRKNIALRCASEIASWLHDEKTGFESGTGFTRLRPKDIAILVRGRSEANEIRAALHAYGLASVYLSDRESVFASAEAHDVLRWLRACAEPGDERKLRAALATASLDLPLSRLEQLNRDELAWETETELFRQLHRLWQTQGVLPMLRQLMQFHDLPQRLINQPDGERSLTNLLHLAEYLQKASAQHEGEQALIRHLAEQMQDPGDEEILRLESDSDLIRVVTIHKAKGLEYPLVCLPFAPALKEVDGRVKQVMIINNDQAGMRRLEISGNKTDADAWQQADHERLSEDMRLLYVALTRARHGLWLGVAAVSSGNSAKTINHKGALGYLMSGGEPMDAINVAEALQRWHEDGNDDSGNTIKLKPAPAIRDPDAFDNPASTPPAFALKPARVSPRSPAENWWIASYSALKTGAINDRAGAIESPEPEAPQDDQVLEEQSTAAEDSRAIEQQQRHDFSRSAPGLHGFHRGPKPGTFLHGLLEWAEAEGFANAASNDESRRQMIAQRCLPRDWQDDVERLDTWLKAFLQTRFVLPDHSSLQLTQLTSQQAEMEFMFASCRVDARELDRLCQQFIQPGTTRPALLPRQLNGMMKGFIDLVFEHQGCFYVADWKSNHLGPTESSYTQQTLAQEILHNRYDVQYAIYLLALHRLLRSRLPTYDYDSHVGGALYFFLRGHAAETQGLVADKPPLAFIEAMDTLFQTGRSILTSSQGKQEVLF